MTRKCSHILPSTLSQHEYWMELAGLKVGHAIKNDIDLRVVNGYFKQAIPTHVITCLCHIWNRNQGHKNGPERGSKNVIRIYNCHVFTLLLFIALFLISSFLGGLLPTFKNPMVESREIILIWFVLFVLLCSCQLYEIKRDKVHKFPWKKFETNRPPEFPKRFQLTRGIILTYTSTFCLLKKENKRKKECGAYL